MGCGRAAVRAAVEGDWPFVTVGQRPKEEVVVRNGRARRGPHALQYMLSMCSGLQTVTRGLANKSRFQLTFCANMEPCQPTFIANEPTFAANSPQTVP